MRRSVTEVIVKGGKFQDWNFMINPIQSRETAVKAVEAWERGDYMLGETHSTTQDVSSTSLVEEKEVTIDMNEEEKEESDDESDDRMNEGAKEGGKEEESDDERDDGLGKTKCCCMTCAGGLILFSQAHD